MKNSTIRHTRKHLAQSAFALTVVGYLALLEVQQRFPEKMLSRRLGALSLPKFILIRSKVWKR